MGDNSYGQLGNGTGKYSNVPICISEIEGNALNGKNIVKIPIADDTMITLDSEGKVYTWGDNYYGQLLDGTNESSYVPMCITDNEKSYVYNKKMKNINISIPIKKCWINVSCDSRRRITYLRLCFTYSKLVIILEQ